MHTRLPVMDGHHTNTQSENSSLQPQKAGKFKMVAQVKRKNYLNSCIFFFHFELKLDVMIVENLPKHL